jgi:ergothioneine biosynthesis protein EgtB
MDRQRRLVRRLSGEAVMSPIAGPVQQVERIEEHYLRVRGQTLALVDGLTAEDCMVQSMTEASPVKWHLAHVTWFFETLVLESWLPRMGKRFVPYRPEFRMLFNSYYIGIGAFHARPERGVLSRPSLEEVLNYRRAVDEQMLELLAAGDGPPDLLRVVALGLNHEQQHQELILTDLKHHFSRNPLLPAYRAALPTATGAAATEMRFVGFPGGKAEIGHSGPGFAFDNECPRHGAWLEPFAIAARPISNGEYLRFVADGGYERPQLWLSDGWDAVTREQWRAPLYWRGDAQFTLAGERKIDDGEPVCHVSYYEADAYARWAGARLPSEAEWEHAAQVATPPTAPAGNFLDSGRFHPVAAAGQSGGIAQLFGDAWEWTQSAYLPYPGFRTSDGAASEYNGKFMVNQMVLRGGSCATPRDHIRASYRNFFHPWTRWQFSGIRLARETP